MQINEANRVLKHIRHWINIWLSGKPIHLLFNWSTRSLFSFDPLESAAATQSISCSTMAQKTNIYIVSWKNLQRQRQQQQQLQPTRSKRCSHHSHSQSPSLQSDQVKIVGSSGEGKKEKRRAHFTRGCIRVVARELLETQITLVILFRSFFFFLSYFLSSVLIANCYLCCEMEEEGWKLVLARGEEKMLAEEKKLRKQSHAITWGEVERREEGREKLHSGLPGENSRVHMSEWHGESDCARGLGDARGWGRTRRRCICHWTGRSQEARVELAACKSDLVASYQWKINPV